MLFFDFHKYFDLIIKYGKNNIQISIEEIIIIIFLILNFKFKLLINFIFLRFGKKFFINYIKENIIMIFLNPKYKEDKELFRF